VPGWNVNGRDVKAWTVSAKLRVLWRCISRAGFRTDWLIHQTPCQGYHDYRWVCNENIYALHLYCQHVGFCGGAYALEDGIANTTFELICSMSVFIKTSLYLLGRNIWTGAASSPLTVRITVWPKRVVSRLAWRMRYLRFKSKSETEAVPSHVTPSNFWMRSIMALKERQIIRTHVRDNKCSGRKERTYR